VIRRMVFVLAAALALSAPAHAQPVDVEGVRYEPALQVAGSRLQLNGAGVRYKAIFKVYAAGLYLGAKAATPEAVLAAPGPKRLHIVMLRDIDANELGRLFARGMQDNAPREEFSRSIAGTLRMAELFSQKKRLAKGENFSVDWLPGAGTQVFINGQPQGEPVGDDEFFSMVLRIWIGDSPADPLLKDALLGQAAPKRDMSTY